MASGAVTLTLPVAKRAVCSVCGRLPRGRAEVSLRAELTCRRHQVLERCLFCRCTRCGDRVPGWGRFGSHPRCPTCSAEAIEDQAAARGEIPGLRRELAAIGIQLATRVLVRLVRPEHMHVDLVDEGVVLGVTESRLLEGRRADVVEIRIAAGLPREQFGRAVAHEVGHAWLTQTGCPSPEPEVEEGLCELFAYAWLKRQTSTFATGLRLQLRQNGDPVYGDGFRRVHAAVVHRGIKPVLISIAATGTLP